MSAIGVLSVLLLAAVAMGSPRALRLGDPLPNLSSNESALFLAGKTGFQAVATVAGGLGPVFNEQGCSACHNVGAIGGGNSRLETRFGRVVDGVFDPMADLGGSALQSQGIGLLDGFEFVAEVVPPQATITAQRRTTPLFGLGLVDAVPDEVLEQIAEEQQVRTPATAGRVNVVLDMATGQQRAGRFGWKCQEATLFSFSGDAALNELGITTPMFPQENCPQGDCALLLNPGLPAVPNSPDNDELARFTHFITFLAPSKALPITGRARQGSLLFARIGCADCHLPRLQTGPNTDRGREHHHDSRSGRAREHQHRDVSLLPTRDRTDGQGTWRRFWRWRLLSVIRSSRSRFGGTIGAADSGRHSLRQKDPRPTVQSPSRRVSSSYAV